MLRNRYYSHIKKKKLFEKLLKQIAEYEKYGLEVDYIEDPVGKVEEEEVTYNQSVFSDLVEGDYSCFKFQTIKEFDLNQGMLEINLSLPNEELHERITIYNYDA